MFPTPKYRVLFSTLLFLVCLGLLAAPSYGQTAIAVSWTDGTGNWSVPTNWNPSGIPNNGASTTYRVTIAASNPIVTGVMMDIPDDTIDSLTLGAKNALTSFNTMSLVSGVSANYGTLGNYGKLNNGSASELTNYGELDSNTHSTLNNSGLFTNSGTFSNLGGLINNTGTTNNIGTLTSSGLITNSTTFNNSGSLNSAGRINNFGTLNNSGTIGSGGTLDFGIINNTGNFGGLLEISKSGLFTSTTDLTMQSLRVNGTLAALGGAIVNIEGGSSSVDGSGTINGNVFTKTYSTVRPGNGLTPGVLTINGNFSNQSGATFDELIDSSSNGLLIVNGSATLGPGSLLNISLLNGFTPAIGEEFSIMDFLNRSGTFVNAPITGFNMDGFNWEIAYNSDDIVLTAGAVYTPEPPTGLLVLTAFLVAFVYTLLTKRQ